MIFADILPDTLNMDPDDLERRITERTKAIMVVHYLALPADMDRIMEIARRHDLKVIEDVSHAHGALYKGKKVGSFGDVAAMSLMSGNLAERLRRILSFIIFTSVYISAPFREG